MNIMTFGVIGIIVSLVFVVSFAVAVVSHKIRLKYEQELYTNKYAESMV